ncbi:MAG: TonB-dependent receptor [Betaproteobacteria bacterium]|nr:TonB-dependent receptor [Betaproteobacteria bacterium]
MSKKKEWRGTAFAKKPAVIATEIALAMMASQYAYAQAVQTAERVERVEVTGTRIPQLSVEGPAPVTVISTENIKIDGASKVEDILRNLPQATMDQGTYQSNGATGTALIGLRGLGANRTLVLVDGRRMPPGSPTQGGYPADLNQIPTPLVQRVELLTGGASAVYGSDAVAGVINFIMNDKFEGLQIDVNHSFYNHGQQNPNGIADIIRGRSVTNPRSFVVPGNVTSDGDITGISMLLGGNFANGRGNATLFAQYKVEDPVLQATRDFSACALNPGDSFTCGGSATSFPGRFRNLNTGANLTVADAAGNTRPFSNATDLFNFGPYNYFQRPAEKYAFNAFAHLDVTPTSRVYTELGFHQDHTLSQIAPSGMFGLIAPARFDNPLLSADWRTQLGLAAPGDSTNVLITRRNLEGGGRQDDIRHTSYRMVFGLKGDIFQHWNYDLFAQTSKVVLQRVYRNDFSITRSTRAMDVRTDPATGLPVCQSVLDGSDLACVPYNIWRLGGVTGAALDYLQIPLFANGLMQQQVQGGTVTSDLGNYGFKLPTARNGIGVVVGLERRKERMDLQTDTNFASGDGFGQGGPNIGRAGKVTLNEWYTEAKVPLIEGRRFADLLSVSGSYRHSNYSTGITTKTQGVGVEWAPVRNYRFRGSYQRAIRAANLEELFLAQGTNLFGMNQDPCGPNSAGTAGPTATLAQCLNTGLPAALYGNTLLTNPAGQYTFLQGGNPALRPEIADTYTAGLVFTPTQNLTGTIDWWSIKIQDVITNAPPLTILTQCLTAGQQCARVRRDALGTLWLPGIGQIVALNDNLGGYWVTGIDLAANYLQRLGSYGSVNFNFNGTLTDKWEKEPLKGLGKFDCAGFVGSQCGAPLPKWRHKARATWTTPWNLDLALTWRYIGKSQQETLSGNSLLSAPTDQTDRELPTRNYIDIAAVWTVDKSLTVRAGVNNVFDKDPPIVSNVLADPQLTLGNGNTFPNTYDVLGRTIFVGATLKW